MNPLLNLMLRRETVLVVFLIVALITGLATAMHAATGGAWAVFLLSMVVYGVLAWFTRERQTLASWALIIILLVKGSGLLLAAFSAFRDASADPALVSVLKGMAGVYLTWGALVLHRERRIQD